MASIKEYAYFIRGSKIALIQKDYTAFQDGQTLTAPDIDIPSGGGTWKSPLEAVTDGIQIEYTSSPGNSLTNEKDDIDIEPYLAKALVLYVKARIAEDGANMEVKTHMMKEFVKMVEKHNNAKLWGPRRIMPGSSAIR